MENNDIVVNIFFTIGIIWYGKLVISFGQCKFVKINIFKVLITSIIFIIELKQYTLKIQQNFKFINNNFYKFIKKFCFVFYKHK